MGNGEQQGTELPGRSAAVDRDGGRLEPPWKLYQQIELKPLPPGTRNGPRGVAARVLGNITDYELIMAQGYEIAHLRSQLEREASPGGVGRGVSGDGLDEKTDL